MKSFYGFSLACLAMMISGCANNVVQEVPDDENLIVSQPMDKKILTSSSNIEKHLVLLYQLETDKKVKPVDIQHNQHLDKDVKTIDSLDDAKKNHVDALYSQHVEKVTKERLEIEKEKASVMRLKSDALKSIQESRRLESERQAALAKEKAEKENAHKVLLQQVTWSGPFLQKTDINWSTDVVDLVKTIAGQVGYSVSEVGQNPKINIVFSAKKEQLGLIIEKISSNVDSFADIRVSHPEKKIVITFKK